MKQHVSHPSNRFSPWKISNRGHLVRIITLFFWTVFFLWDFTLNSRIRKKKNWLWSLALSEWSLRFLLGFVWVSTGCASFHPQSRHITQRNTYHRNAEFWLHDLATSKFMCVLMSSDWLLMIDYRIGHPNTLSFCSWQENYTVKISVLTFLGQHYETGAKSFVWSCSSGPVWVGFWPFWSSPSDVDWENSEESPRKRTIENIFLKIQLIKVELQCTTNQLINRLERNFKYEKMSIYFPLGITLPCGNLQR